MQKKKNDKRPNNLSALIHILTLVFNIKTIYDWFLYQESRNALATEPACTWIVLKHLGKGIKANLGFGPTISEYLAWPRDATLHCDRAGVTSQSDTLFAMPGPERMSRF